MSTPERGAPLEYVGWGTRTLRACLRLPSRDPGGVLKKGDPRPPQTLFPHPLPPRQPLLSSASRLCCCLLGLCLCPCNQGRGTCGPVLVGPSLLCPCSRQDFGHYTSHRCRLPRLVAAFAIALVMGFVVGWVAVPGSPTSNMNAVEVPEHSSFPSSVQGAPPPPCRRTACAAAGACAPDLGHALVFSPHDDPTLPRRLPGIWMGYPQLRVVQPAHAHFKAVAPVRAAPIWGTWGSGLGHPPSAENNNGGSSRPPSQKQLAETRV